MEVCNYKKKLLYAGKHLPKVCKGVFPAKCVYCQQYSEQEVEGQEGHVEPIACFPLQTNQGQHSRVKQQLFSFIFNLGITK